MNITNGSVSRTVKPAAYEARTVTYSYTFDDSDDAEACTAKVIEMAERGARGARWTPTPVGTSVPITSAAEVASENPSASASAVSQLSSGVETTAPDITDADLDVLVTKLIHEKNVSAGEIKKVIVQFTGQPGVSMKTLDQPKRPLFVNALNALANSTPASEPAF